MGVALRALNEGSAVFEKMPFAHRCHVFVISLQTAGGGVHLG